MLLEGRSRNINARRREPECINIMCKSSVSNVIYHKFSHVAAFYTLNGKNVNVMLECSLKPANGCHFFNKTDILLHPWSSITRISCLGSYLVFHRKNKVSVIFY